MHANLSVRQRLVAGFGCVLLLMGLVVAFSAVRFAEMRKTNEYIAGSLLPQVSAANDFALAISEEQTAVRGYALTGDMQFVDRLSEARGREQSALTTLGELLKEGEDLTILAELNASSARMQEYTDQCIALLASEGEDRAFRYHQDNVRPTAEKALVEAETLAHSALHRVTTTTAEYNVELDELSRGTLLALGGALLLGLAFITITVRSVSRPAKTISQATTAISNGSYEEALNLPRIFGRDNEPDRNELSKIAVSIGSMAKTLWRREQLLKANAEISRVCASSLELQTLMDEGLAQIASSTNSQIGAIYILGFDELHAQATYGISADVANLALTGPEGLPEQAAKSGEMIVLRDIPEDIRFVIQPGLGKVLPSAMACVPMAVEDQTIGVAVFASLYDYDAETTDLMQTSVAQMGTALSNALRHLHVQELAGRLQDMNEQLDSQNEELQSQNEELQAQSEEIQAQSEELQASNEELQAQRAELERHTAELEALMKDLIALQSVTAVALFSQDKDELLDRLLETAAGVMDFDCGLVMLVEEDGETLNCHTAFNIQADVSTVFQQNTDEGFVGRVVRSRQVESTADVLADPACTEPYIRQLGIRALVGIPIMDGTRLHGVALLGSAETRQFSEREEHLFQVFAERAAVAIERAQSYELLTLAEQSARVDRERMQAIVDNLPEGVVIVTEPKGEIYMMNKAAFTLYGLDCIPRTEIHKHADAFSLYRQNGEAIASEDLPLSRSFLLGETCTGVEVLIRQPGGREIVVLCNTVPMKAEDGRITGAIAVFQDISAIKAQQNLLQEGYEHQRGIAETLQKSFLPETLLKVSEYDIADAYLPALEDAQVGGDFYDLIELGDGMVGVVMADVSGKGVSAAVHTAMAKYMLRAFAHEDPEPSVVLARLNEAVTRYVQGEVFITLFYGVLHTHDRRLIYANGGHELPLIYECKSGKCLTLDSTGPAVGVIPGATYIQMEADLSEGDAVILYTDGITEARKGKKFLGMDGLRKIVNNCGGRPSRAIVDSIVEGVQEYTRNKLHDDVALLVIRRDTE